MAGRDAAGLATALDSLDSAAQARLAAVATEVLAPEGDGAEVVGAVLQAIRG